jgi:plasmid replication initiation protein
MSSIDAQLARIRANIEANNKNTNKEADSSPLHDLVDNTVTKSNSLARAYYRFSLVEKRCMEALISKLHPMRSDNLLIDLELRATEYAKAFPDVGKHAYEHLEKAASELVRKVIATKKLDGGGNWSEMPLMSEVRYCKTEGKVVYTFNPKIVPHLMILRGKFTKYSLRTAANFTSSYTWRFYEILASWAQKKEKTGGLFAGWIDNQSVDELRGMLGVPESYNWATFEKKVLNLAIGELKEKANINVHLTQKKTVRKITHLSINFIEDDQVEMQLEGGEQPKKKRGRKPKEA